MERISDWLNRNSLYIALLTAWIAMCGSLYFSEVRGYIPCTLCWYQRILMYPLAGFILIGMLRRDYNLPYYVIPFSVFGMGISAYHYLLQKTDLFGHSVCSQGVPCSTQWINWLGFITIPFLALIGFLVITLMSVVALLNGQPAMEDEEGNPIHMPLLRVGGLVLVVLAVFAALFILGSEATAAATGTSGTITMAEVTPGPFVAADTELIARGDGLYHSTCAGCHGVAGVGVPNLGSPLAGSAFLAEKTDGEILAFVREGREHTDPANTSGQIMPPSGGRPDLSDEEMLAAIAYLRSLPGQ